MSALHKPGRPDPTADDIRLTFRPIALLFALALAVSLLVGAFAAIVTVVAGLAGLAAYAATHPPQRT